MKSKIKWMSLIVCMLFVSSGVASTEMGMSKKSGEHDGVTVSCYLDDPPEVVIEYPEDGTTFCMPDITLRGYMRDDFGIAAFQIQHEWTDAYSLTTTSMALPLPTYIPFEFPFVLYEGWNRLTVTATDATAQNGVDMITVYYYLDTEPPAIFIDYPPDGSMFCGPDITIRGYFTDNCGAVIDKILHEFTGNSISHYPLWTTYHTYYSFEDTFFTLREGWNRITYFAIDRVGLSSSTSITLTYHPLEVESISGGFGASAAIKNNGGVAASNIPWSIDISGLVFLGGHNGGTISSIPAGDEVVLSSGFVFGFGPATITATAGCTSKTVNCFILGPLVIGVT